MAGASNTLRQLNLSNTGLSGQLPRTDMMLPNLVSLDVSNTKLTGHIPPILGTVTTCKASSNPGLCYYSDSAWINSNPKGCNEGVKVCESGKAPDPSPPVYPEPLRPHIFDFKEPYPEAGLISFIAQCDTILDWLIAHDADPVALWARNTSCSRREYRPKA
jgi:hypothetical protein